MKNSIAKNIKAFRSFYGESQDMLAVSLEMSPGAISNYENGTRTPKEYAMKKLADHYHVSIDELMYGDFQHLEDCPLKEITRDILIKPEILFPNENALCGEINQLFFQGFLLKNKTDFEKYKWLYADKKFALNEMLRECYLEEFLMDEDNMDEQDENENLENIKKQLTLKIKELKKQEVGLEIADYYLALKYIFGLSGGERLGTIGEQIGISILDDLVIMGNPYAIRLKKEIFNSII